MLHIVAFNVVPLLHRLFYCDKMSKIMGFFNVILVKILFLQPLYLLSTRIIFLKPVLQYFVLWKGFYSFQTPSSHSESFRHLKQHIAILLRRGRNSFRNHLPFPYSFVILQKQQPKYVKSWHLKQSLHISYSILTRWLFFDLPNSKMSFIEHKEVEQQSLLWQLSEVCPDTDWWGYQTEWQGACPKGEPTCRNTWIDWRNGLTLTVKFNKDKCKVFHRNHNPGVKNRLESTQLGSSSVEKD